MFKKQYVIVCAFLFFPHFSNCQKYINDSLVVEFNNSELPQIKALVDTVIDLRNSEPNCIAIYEKTKYYAVPVDVFVLTSKPLHVGLKNMFVSKPDSLIKKSYKLEIKEFEIKRKSQFFKNEFTCNSVISVYSAENKKYSYLGSLVYESQNISKKNRKHPEKEYEIAIDSWKEKFASDMNEISLYASIDTTFSLPNFRKEQSNFRKNMIVSAEYAFGNDSWLVDGEILFSRPEAKSQFNRVGSILRYRHEKKYESFETGLQNIQRNYRLNNNFMFCMKAKLFLGLNLWNNNEYAKHGLEDILLLDFSFSQSIIFNPLYKKGIVFGLGVMEDATYIYSEGNKYNIYLVAQLGIKL
jgi:hypothetical protein